MFGGLLPVYAGTRYQRGGGILSSLANFLMPAAKRMVTETAKAVPGVVGNIITRKQAPRAAVLGGLKRAGVITAADALAKVRKTVPVRRQVTRRNKAPQKRKIAPRKTAQRKTAKKRPADVFG